MMNTFPPNCAAWVPSRHKQDSRQHNDLRVSYMHSGMHTALHTTALDRNLHRAISGDFDLLGSVLWRQARLDQNRTHTRNELLCKIKAALEEIGDDNGLGACSTC